MEFCICDYICLHNDVMAINVFGFVSEVSLKVRSQRNSDNITGVALTTIQQTATSIQLLVMKFQELI